jgi:hypothetical protein
MRLRRGEKLYSVQTRMGGTAKGKWGNVGVTSSLPDARRSADWFAEYHGGGRVVKLDTGRVVFISRKTAR